MSALGEKISVSQQKLRQKIQVSCDWYYPCIRSFVWLKGLPEDLYVEFLCFIAVNWKGHSSHLQNSPLLKYIASYNNTDLTIVSNDVDHIRIYISS